MPKKTNGVAPEFRTLLELHEPDDAALKRLVQRYQEMIWQSGGSERSSKIFTVRQLIRHMDAQDKLPAILGADSPPVPAPARRPKPKARAK